jgi:hypothetical protein
VAQAAVTALAGSDERALGNLMPGISRGIRPGALQLP